MIRIKSDPDWLEMGEVQKEEDFLRLAVKINRGIEIRPPQQYSWNSKGNIKEGQQVRYQVGEETKPQPPRDNELLKVQLTVTVQLQSEALLTAATAMAGMIPGGAAAVAAGLGLSKVVTYVVQPPKVTWLASVQEPFRLSSPRQRSRPGGATRDPGERSSGHQGVDLYLASRLVGAGYDSRGPLPGQPEAADRVGEN